MSISSILPPAVWSSRSTLSSQALPSSSVNMMLVTNSKRKLDQIIANLSQSDSTSSSPSSVAESSTSEQENKDHNTTTSVLQKSSKKKLKTGHGKKVSAQAKQIIKMESDDSQESTQSSEVHNPIVESIRADFLLQQIEAISSAQQQQQAENESALRERLLEPSSHAFHSQQQTNHNNSSSSPSNLDQSSPSDLNNNIAILNLNSLTRSPTHPVKVTNVYRGLYPIKNVKEYFKKKTVDNQKLYICQWPGCSFQTWKYSQHISRHIYLKHIGIKELKCQVSNCEKVFKRPESLVQHVKNHICGFGIDPIRMKDPNNTCGVKNIKRHFNKIMDNDIQVFMCQFDKCKFVTNNSGSIRRHVHNQHICPHSSPAAAAASAAAAAAAGNSANGNSGSSSNKGSRSGLNNSARSGSGSNGAIDSSPFMSHFTSGSGSNSSSSNSNTPDEENAPAFNPEVVLTEFEGTYDPVNRSINHESSADNHSDDADSITDMPMDFSLPRINSSVSASLNRIDDDDDEEEEDDQEMVDHDQDMEVPMGVSQTGQTSMNHLANGGHFIGGLPPELVSDPVTFARFAGIPSTSTSAPTIQAYLTGHRIAGTSGMLSAAAIPETLGPLSAEAAAAEAAAAAARRKNNGLYSLKNYKEYYYKIRTPESGVQFICKGCKFQAKSQITLIRHLWNELGYKEFHCEFEGCNRTFDNEFSRYKHRKFDHGQPAQGQAQMGVMDPLMAGQAEAAMGLMGLAGSAVNGPAERYSPIPPLVPMPTQVPTATLAPNSSYNSIASALLTLGHHPAAVVTTAIPITTTIPAIITTCPSTYLPNFGPAITTTSASLIPAPSLTHHLPVMASTVVPQVPQMQPAVLGLPIGTTIATTTVAIIPSLVDRIIPTFASNTQLITTTSSPRRHSNSSEASSTSGQVSNSSLISILQAPSVAATTQIAPTTLHSAVPHLSLLGGNPNAAEVSLRPTFPSPLHSSSPLNSSNEGSSKLPKSGIYSMKNYADQYERILQPGGDSLYRCLHCENYHVRSQVAIVKHLRAHLRGDILPDGSERAMTPPSGTASNDPRPRTSSMLSSGAFSSGGEIDEDEEQEISVEDDEPNASLLSSEVSLSFATTSEQADKSGAQQGAIRKYNSRSKSGLYSLKKHEQDYIRSKGPDGYHYKCANCDEYTTKSQASMVRHIWTHKKQHFRCDCGDMFENEFSLYKHKKTTHPELTTQHNRSSSKNSNAKKNNANANSANNATTTATAISASSSSVPSTSKASAIQSASNSTTADYNSNNEQPQMTEQQFQQQAQFLQWLHMQQQFLAMQQLQQQQQQQQGGSNNSNQNTFPTPSEWQMINFAHMYQSLQNANNAAAALEAREEGENEDHRSNRSESGESEESDAKSTTSSSALNREPEQKGMSRRALRFKSQKSKPIQIKPEDEEEERPSVEKTTENNNAEESDNELSIDNDEQEEQ